MFSVEFVCNVCEMLCESARQFYDDYKRMFDDSEDDQPILLALQFITSRDEIETSKPVREFRYVL